MCHVRCAIFAIVCLLFGFPDTEVASSICCSGHVTGGGVAAGLRPFTVKETKLHATKLMAYLGMKSYWSRRERRQVDYIKYDLRFSRRWL
jgi:hypothetical protein